MKWKSICVLLMVIVIAFSNIQVVQKPFSEEISVATIRASPLGGNGWWHTDWDYYKQITLSNTDNNYPMHINVTKDDGAINCSGHCLDTFADIRFVNIANTTACDYWIEKYVSGAYTWIWIKLPSDIETDSTINMYYGNVDATSESDGVKTFLYFDDWTVDNTSDWWSFRETAGGGDDTANNVLNITGGVGYDKRLRYRHTMEEWWTVGTGCSLRIGYCSDEWDVTYQYPDHYTTTLTTASASDGSTATAQAWNVYSCAAVCGGTAYEVTDPFSPSSYYVRDFTIISDNITSIIYADNGTVLNKSSEVNPVAIPLASDLDNLFMLTYVDTGPSHFEHNASKGELIVGGYRTTTKNVFSIDWMFMSKYNDPEPSISSVGSEQTQSGANLPPVITNEYPTNGSIDMPVTPTLHIQVNDSDADSMDITWYHNASADFILDSVYNLTDQAFPYGDEARYAVYVNTTDTVYLFGGGTPSGNEWDIFKWKIGSIPIQLSDATQSIKTGRPVWDWKAGKIYVYCNNNIYWLDPTEDSNGTTTEGYGDVYTSSFAAYSPVQNKSYIFGGRNWTAYEVVNYTWVHDASAGTFTRMMNNNLTLPVTSMAGAYVPEQDAIYLLGARGAPAGTMYDDIYRFNCSTETLTNLKTMYGYVKCPTDVEGMATFYHPGDQLIYCFGGLSDEPSYPTYQDKIWSFNPFNYMTSYPIVNLSVTIPKRTDDFSGIFNTSSGYGYLLPCNDVGSDDNDNTRQRYITQVNFTSGSDVWRQFSTNISVYNGTYYQANSNFSEYNTKYWWKVTVTDGVNWANSIYQFTTIETSLPRLTNPSVEPVSGVADYTIFFFNITWADSDGKNPTDGYLKVNISRIGWYTNQSMIWISGSNTTGALYSYDTSLTAGSYTYIFYAYNGIAYNSSGPYSNPSVSAQSISFTISTASSTGDFEFMDWTLSGWGVGLSTEYNISEDNQTSIISAFSVTNTGNVPVNISIMWLSSPGSGITMKWSSTNSAPNPSDADITVSPTETQIITNLALSDTEEIWLWLDFVSVSAQDSNVDVRFTSELCLS